MKKTMLRMGLLLTILVCISEHATAEEWHICQPKEVMEMSDRVHVKCETAILPGLGTNPGRSVDRIPQIWFIAVGTRYRSKADRFVSLATTALTCGYTFRVRISSDGQDNTENCLLNDCRSPSAFGLVK